MSVIQRMGMVATDKDDRPKSPITIHKATPFHGPPPPMQEQKQEATSFMQLAAATS
jgi:hypothetical protein